MSSLSVPLRASFKLDDASSIAFFSASETLVQASMKLGEAIYKSQEKKEGSPKDGDNNDETKKDDNVVDADFEEVKEEETKEDNKEENKKEEDKEKSA